LQPHSEFLQPDSHRHSVAPVWQHFLSQPAHVSVLHFVMAVSPPAQVQFSLSQSAFLQSVQLHAVHFESAVQPDSVHFDSSQPLQHFDSAHSLLHSPSVQHSPSLLHFASLQHSLSQPC
jgi:hypothetical protein